MVELKLEVVGVYFAPHPLTGENVIQVNFGKMIKRENMEDQAKNKFIATGQIIGVTVPKIDMAISFPATAEIPYKLGSKWKIKIDNNGKMEMTEDKA